MESADEKTEEGWIDFYESFADLFEFFCDNTTIHGTIRMNCSRRNAMKTSFWVFLFFCSFGMMYWQFGDAIHQYWAYPTSLAILLQTTKNTFPAVTICNHNPYRFKQVNEYLNQLDHLAEETLRTMYGYNASLHQHSDEEIVNLEDILGNESSQIYGSFRLDTTITLVKLDTNNQNQTDPGKKNSVGYKLCNSTGKDCYYRSFCSGVDALQEWYRFHFMNIMSKIPLVLQIPDDKFMDNFILTCDFNGSPCDRNYIHFHHPTYGTCFTINGNQGNETLWATVKPGKQYGLSLTVTTDRRGDIPILSNSAGAKVLIHNPNQPPLVEHEGFDIFPGTEISLSIRQDQVNRLGAPYSDCTSDGSNLDVQLLYNTTYTQQACLQSCFQHQMIEQCGCSYYFFPLVPGTEYCDYNKHLGWGHCFYGLYDNLLHHKLICFNKCPKQCSETMYYLSTGSAKWPSPVSKEWVMPILTDHYGFNSSTDRSGLSKINVYFQELSLQTFAETPAIDIHDMLSTMGNQWSFWFGSSVLSVVEIAELVFDIAAMLIIVGHQRYRKKMVKRYDDAPSYDISMSEPNNRIVPTLPPEPLPIQDPDSHQYPEDNVGSQASTM